MKLDDILYKIEAAAVIVALAAFFFGVIGAAWRFWMWVFE